VQHASESWTANLWITKRYWTVSMLSTEPVKSPDVKYKVCFTLFFEYPRYTTSILTYIKTNLDYKTSNVNEDVTSKNRHESSTNRTVSEQFLTLTVNNSVPASKAFIINHSQSYTTITNVILYHHHKTGSRNKPSAIRHVLTFCDVVFIMWAHSIYHTTFDDVKSKIVSVYLRVWFYDSLQCLVYDSLN